jgi:hypothetical protein
MATSTDRVRRFRERQAAKLAAVPDAAPRDEDELLLPAAEVTIAALGLGERDQAAAQVVRTLARTIDAAADPAAALRVFGPQLLKVLESLGGTPMARSRLPVKRPERPDRPNAIAQLRQAHMNSPAKRKRLGGA